MAFPRKYLNEGEDIVLEMRPHWFFLAGPAVALLLILVLAIVVSSKVAGDVQRLALIPLLLLVLSPSCGSSSATPSGPPPPSWSPPTASSTAPASSPSRAGRSPSSASTTSPSTPTIFQRMLGAGDLLIESAGERGQQLFSSFPHPEKTQNLIHHQIEQAQARDADRMAGRRELSPLEQLEKLEELRQRGVISQAEFDVKKAKLLDRL